MIICQYFYRVHRSNTKFTKYSEIPSSTVTKSSASMILGVVWQSPGYVNQMINGAEVLGGSLSDKECILRANGSREAQLLISLRESNFQHIWDFQDYVFLAPLARLASILSQKLTKIQEHEVLPDHYGGNARPSITMHREIGASTAKHLTRFLNMAAEIRKSFKTMAGLPFSAAEVTRSFNCFYVTTLKFDLKRASGSKMGFQGIGNRMRCGKGWHGMKWNGDMLPAPPCK